VVQFWAKARQKAKDAPAHAGANLDVCSPVSSCDVKKMLETTNQELILEQLKSAEEIKKIATQTLADITKAQADIQEASNNARDVKDKLSKISAQIDKLSDMFLVYQSIADGTNAMQKCQNSLADGFEKFSLGEKDNTTAKALEEYCDDLENYTLKLNVTNVCPEKRRLANIDDLTVSALPSAAELEWCKSTVEQYMPSDLNWKVTEEDWGINYSSSGDNVHLYIKTQVQDQEFVEKECRTFLSIVRAYEMLAAAKTLADNHAMLASMTEAVKNQTSEVAAMSNDCVSDIESVTEAYEAQAENFLVVLQCQTLLTENLIETAKITTSTKTTTTATQTTQTTTTMPMPVLSGTGRRWGGWMLLSSAALLSMSF